MSSFLLSYFFREQRKYISHRVEGYKFLVFTFCHVKWRKSGFFGDRGHFIPIQMQAEKRKISVFPGCWELWTFFFFNNFFFYWTKMSVPKKEYAGVLFWYFKIQIHSKSKVERPEGLKASWRKKIESSCIFLAYYERIFKSKKLIL